MKVLFLSILVALSALVAPLMIQSVPAYANSQGEVLQGIGDTGGCNDQACADKKVNSLFSTAVYIISYVIGAIAVIMILVGGFKYITAGGDSNGVSNAKTTIIYALVGLAIAGLAQLLVKFVLTAVK